ncbi:MAG: hypothetical protein FWD32_01185 [Firmicutes bacterium]|nr:hypothetical protein [Bacillota bacterium]
MNKKEINSDLETQEILETLETRRSKINRVQVTKNVAKVIIGATTIIGASIGATIGGDMSTLGAITGFAVGTLGGAMVGCFAAFPFAASALNAENDLNEQNPEKTK